MGNYSVSMTQPLIRSVSVVTRLVVIRGAGDHEIMFLSFTIRYVP